MCEVIPDNAQKKKFASTSHDKQPHANAMTCPQENGCKMTHKSCEVIRAPPHIYDKRQLASAVSGLTSPKFHNMCPHAKIKRKPVKIYIFVDDSITDSSLYDIFIPKDGFAQGSIVLTRN